MRSDKTITESPNKNIGISGIAKVLISTLAFQELPKRSREDWIKLCNVQVHSGPGRRPTRGYGTNDRRHGESRKHDQESENTDGNRVWPPTNESRDRRTTRRGGTSRRVNPPRRVDERRGPEERYNMDDTEIIITPKVK